jgi:hypothetical protein
LRCSGCDGKPDTATLKVQADRAMRDVVFIDSVQRPTDNLNPSAFSR